MEIPAGEFTRWMHLNRGIPPTPFEYPSDRLLPLRGIIEEDKLRSPQMLDTNDERCISVIKNGFNGMTIGCATGTNSLTREYLKDGSHRTSMQWAIMQYNYKSGAFSGPGDSGAIIVDGKGRIGGLLIGGAGDPDSRFDITYAIPFYWLLQRIKAKFPDVCVYY